MLAAAGRCKNFYKINFQVPDLIRYSGLAGNVRLIIKNRRSPDVFALLKVDDLHAIKLLDFKRKMKLSRGF